MGHSEKIYLLIILILGKTPQFRFFCVVKGGQNFLLSPQGFKCLQLKIMHVLKWHIPWWWWSGWNPSLKIDLTHKNKCYVVPSIICKSAKGSWDQKVWELMLLGMIFKLCALSREKKVQIDLKESISYVLASYSSPFLPSHSQYYTSLVLRYSFCPLHNLILFLELLHVTICMAVLP